ncbi:hypothetical protein SK128_024388 [Halocaridina rubra]|uniref:Uncharacterized protein n=1 Tax=Halocaridina rubra TaxID=373956 RepID=A0AAN8XPZ5_HALRR
MCPEAAEDGASIIHGNAMAFVSGAEMKLQVLFEAWENHTPGTSLRDLMNSLKTNLNEVTKLRMPSKCAQIPEIDDILTKELQNHVN